MGLGIVEAKAMDSKKEVSQNATMSEKDCALIAVLPQAMMVCEAAGGGHKRESNMPNRSSLNIAGLAEVTSDLSSYSRDSWYELREFETRDITSRSYRDRHSKDPSAAKGREIAASFAQAREYFRSALVAHPTVRPLLQYYGVSTLSRGLVLFMSPGIRETQLKEGHGLVRSEWKGVLHDSSREFGALRVKMRSGLFQELLAAIDNKFYFRHGSHEVSFPISARFPRPNCEFTFEEIAARIPDISDQCAAWLGTRPPFIPMVSASSDDYRHRFEFVLPKKLSGPISLSVAELSELGLDDIFPDDECPNRTIDGSGDHVVVGYDQPFVPFLAQQIEQSGSGRVLIYEPLQSREYLSPLAACFVLSFTLGMLCRYFPTTWVNLARSEKGDSIYPFIVRATDWIQAMFPSMVVDILRGPYFFEE